MKTLVFDTETNGKRPKARRGETIALADEPAVVQLAAILFEDTRPVAHMSCFMQPLDGYGKNASIPTEKFFIESGITQDVVDSAGTTYSVGLPFFNNMVRRADRIVAHNIGFDDPILRAAYARIAAPQHTYWKTPKFCTMRTLVDVLKLPGRYGHKFPTLDEAYRALVNPDGFSGAHDAMVDVQACAEVLFACEQKGYDLWQLKENWPDAG